jgi:hypothetical protein
MRGCKTDGRAAGTPNKRTADVAERLEALSCDPLEALAKIAADPINDTALRARVYADLLPYLYPKRKAVEISGPDGGIAEIDLAGAKEKLMQMLDRKFSETDGVGSGL